MHCSVVRINLLVLHLQHEDIAPSKFDARPTDIYSVALRVVSEGRLVFESSYLLSAKEHIETFRRTTYAKKLLDRNI